MATEPSETKRPDLPPAVPDSLRAFLARGERTIEAEDEDWEVDVERPAKYLVKHLPVGAVIIGHNGVGDHLFLVPDPEKPALLANKVQVYRHEGPEITLLAEDIASLVNPPAPTPTARPPVLYHDGQAAVQLGDEVTARSFFRRRTGRVVYVPGISEKNRDMEHHGLCWVAIDLENGARIATVVNPDTSRLKKSVHFLRRSAEGFQPMGPHERLE